MSVDRDLRKFWIVPFVWFLVTGLAHARTITVGHGVGYDYMEIQQAIFAARAGDTIVVASGTYREFIYFRGTNIVLTSTDPNDQSVVQKTVVTYSDGSVVRFAGQEGPSCVLQGFTVSGGEDYYGGGIRGRGTMATIRNCIISGNDAVVGGGLHDCDGLIEGSVIYGNDGAGLRECDGIISNCIISSNRASEGGGLSSCNGEIVGCTINGNHASKNGGGLYDCNGTISECTINENSSTDFGGGLYGCNSVITGCTIRDNVSGDSGGGLYGCNGPISECAIRGNVSENSGGGLFGCNGSIKGCTIAHNQSPAWHGGGAMDCNSFADCIITGNAARGYGGGLYRCKKVTGCTITGNSTVVYPGGGLSQCDSVTNCFVSGNIAGANGGGLHDCPKIVNCTIVGNYAAGQGGAIYYQDVGGLAANNIIWDNIGAAGGQVLVECKGARFWDVLIKYCNVQGGRDSAVVAPGSKLLLESNNLDVDPLFVRPGHWASGNEWIEGDYHLLARSPCIDEGDPDADYRGQTDIDGQQRVFGLRADIGADESTYVPPVLVRLEIEGAQEVTEQTSAQYTVMAYYDDDSAVDVTTEASWSVEPEGIGAIDASGLLTVGELYESIELIITAAYAEGQVERTAQKAVLCVDVPEPTGIYYVDGAIGNDENDGLSPEAAFKTIQRGIKAAEDGDMVLVYPGVYRENVRFKGKAITVASAEDAAILENPDDFAVSFYYGEGPASVLKNFVIRSSMTGVFVAGSSPTIRNLTIVDNEYGIECYGGQPDVSNCILWGNVEADLTGCSARYSCVERGDEGQGNISIDPLFVDPNNGDFHLHSERGRYWPEHKVWVLDELTSPCIDAGDFADDYTPEREPNGGRINMGAYGGTGYASMSEEQPFSLDVNGDGVIDTDDLMMIFQLWFEAVK